MFGSMVGKESVTIFRVNMVSSEYSRLSLSQSPRDSLKHFKISVPRHIRFAELRKTLNRTTTFNKLNM